MRVKLEVLPWLSEALGAGVAEKRVLEEDLPEGTTLRALLEQLHDQYHRFGRLVFDRERGRLTGHAEIAVNGAIYDLAGGLDARLRDGDVVTFLPGLAGGQAMAWIGASVGGLAMANSEERGHGAMLRQFDLGGRLAVVTGASRGLGAAMALALAEAGADLVLVARTEDALRGVANRIVETGRRAVPLAADVSQVAGIDGVFERISSECGRIDILVNAAGVQVRKPILEVTEDDWERVVAVNMKAVYFCSQAAARRMMSQGGGKIINIASLTSTIGILNASVYGATKGGVVSLTRSMALEWARYGINVNAIGPGYFATELTTAVHQDPARSQWVVDRTPMGRWGVPGDLAGTVVFLASAASDFITGELINVDGGWLAS